MKFSAIIIARDEEKSIGNAITSLLNQSVPREEYEIIAVVDALSVDNTYICAQKAGADIIVHEKIGGTNLSRQLGVKKSRGDIVAFLDADCTASYDWLEKIERTLLDNGVVGVSGPYEHAFKGLRKKLDFLYNHLMLPTLPHILHVLFRKKAGVMIGGNMAAWRWAIDKIGGLPPLKFYGDDAAIAMLLSRKCGTVVFNPSLVVHTSPRRFKNGLLKPVMHYAKAYLEVYFDKKYR